MLNFLICLILVIAGLFTNVCAERQNELNIVFCGKQISFNSSPIIENDRTLVQLRPIAEAMGLNIIYDDIENTVFLSSGNTMMRFSVDSEYVSINGVIKKMDVKMRMKDNYTFVPVRNIAEPFGYLVSYDAATKTVGINKGFSLSFFENSATATEKRPDTAHTYYTQSDERFGFENNGRGYCWVCSYAMVMSDAKNEAVSPVDIAKINESKGYSGSYISGHLGIVASFGCKLVPALDKSSPYFGGFESEKRGATTLKISSDADAYNAIKEALIRFPYGVIVRFDRYPHSMVAVGYDSENIYFNDPGLKDGEYKKLSDTCLKNYSLSEVTFIQAIEKR